MPNDPILQAPEQYTPAQLSDGTILHFKGQLTPDQVRDKVAAYRLKQPSQPGDAAYANNQARRALTNIIKPDELNAGIDSFQSQKAPAEEISAGLGNSISKNDRAALQQANATGKAPEGQVWSSYGPRMLKSAVDAGRNVAEHPLLTAGVIAANTNPVTGIPVDAALAAHGGYGVYQHRQALKDLVTTGNANPDELEAGLNSGAEAVSGVAGVRGQLATLKPTIPQQNIAAQKALAPAPRHAQATQADIEGSRPYLGGQGVKSQADLQTRIPGAENEIWQPYEKGLERFGNETVNGPNGPTNYNALEARRVELSNQLQSLNAKDPVAAQTIISQGKTPAQLLDEQNAIEGLLDERFRLGGINSPVIRKTIGSVKGVERQVSGRNTLTEQPQRYGFGRMAQDADFNLLRPIKSLGNTAKGVVAGTKDLVAGRPLWSGKPTDVGIAEGFRSGAPKPSFDTTTYRQPIGPQVAPPVLPPLLPPEPLPSAPGVNPENAAEGPPLWNPAVGNFHSNSLWKTGTELPDVPNPSSPLFSGKHAVHEGSWDFGPSQPNTTPPPVMPSMAVESTGTVQPIALGPGTGGPTYRGPLRPAARQIFPALPAPSGGALPPPPSPVVPSPQGSAPPSGNAPAPTGSAPQSSSVPPTLPPMPPPAPLNPQEIIDFTNTLRSEGYTGPVTEDNIYQLMRDANAVRTNQQMAAGRPDAVSATREAHRATLTKPR